MDKGNMRKILLAGLVSCLFFLVSEAQNVVKATVDKSEILIGERFTLRIEAVLLPENYFIQWPFVPDSIAHFEVISRGKIDSTFKGNQVASILQTITLTSFDSGKWVIPAFSIKFDPQKGDTSYQYLTDALPITVSFSTTDTSSVLKDIKPIKEVEMINPIWYWVSGGILFIVIASILVWLYKRSRKKKPAIAEMDKVSPFEEAMLALEKLKEYDLAEPTSLKVVHSRLGEILKRYLSRRNSQNYLNKTADEMLMIIRDLGFDKSIISKTASSLRCGNAVKFAKYRPPVSESEECLRSINEVIINIQQQSLNAKF